ncbi:MAG TPA: uroporphyrinogen decarboxylase family protein [Ruminiclostridium sp.]
MIYTKRERVIQTLMHKEADMVPIDFASTRSTGINALAYYKLKEYLKFHGKIKIFDLKQLLALPEKDTLNFFQTDCIQLHRLAPSAGLKINQWRSEIMLDGNEYEIPANYNPLKLPDGSHAIVDSNNNILLKRPKGGLYFDDVYAQLADASSNEEIDNFIYPCILEEDLSYLKKEAEHLYNKTDYAIVATVGVSIVEKGIKDFGYEEFLVKIYTDKELVTRYLENLTDAYIKLLDKYLDAIGQYIQVLYFNDDLGMQTGPLMAPEKYREIFKPYHKRIFSYVKKKAPNVFILLHSCGSIYDVIPDLIDAGVDAINPVQINANKMDPVILKREFGKDLTFWGGGCSTQTTLTFGSIKDIQDEVKRMIDIFSPNGGFIFNQVHNIQSNISPEKIIALYKTAIENRKYL